MSKIADLLATAHQGDAQAHELGWAYMKGEGIKPDLIEAYFWLCLANRSTGIFWSPSPDELMEEIARKISGPEVHRAVTRAMEWFDRHQSHGAK
jgi:hypothetical protein